MKTPRITVWYLIGNLNVGGTERTLVDLANELDSEQYDVTVWTIENTNPLASELAEHVTHRSLHAAGKADIRAVVKFIRAVRTTKPDIVQSFLFYDNLLAVLSGVINSDTRIITGVRAVPSNPDWYRDSVRRVIHLLADCTVSNSDSGADFITERGVALENVRVIRNGRNLAVYRSGNASTDLRESLQIPADVQVVGTVGRLIERKGHHDLLKAWPQVLDSNPNAHLLLIGDGPEMESLARTASRMRISDSVHLVGRREDIPDLLDLMDVFVFPSHFEGLPGALLEAMAAGLPIVTTPVNGNSELVADGETGLFVPPRSPAELSNRINRLLADPDHAKKLGEQAATVAQSNYTTERMVKEFETLYQQLLSEKGEIR